MNDQRVAQFLKSADVGDGHLLGALGDPGKSQAHLGSIERDRAVKLDDLRHGRRRRRHGHGHLVLREKFFVIDALRDVQREGRGGFENQGRILGTWIWAVIV